eukprot:6070457-Pleurochrysis_carterae.AAC.1
MASHSSSRHVRIGNSRAEVASGGRIRQTSGVWHIRTSRWKCTSKLGSSVGVCAEDPGPRDPSAGGRSSDLSAGGGIPTLSAGLASGFDAVRVCGRVILFVSTFGVACFRGVRVQLCVICARSFVCSLAA